ncbi:hypothetical protein AVEN_73439-1 [Araneus ventricosus]|uniref:Zinc finger PHD-type domain-containing protein n=1 Tax=Araneus ventricosus TaxID=182803 RepID=A0A4Y2GIG8_ARAVE|nr:hypothetical protein AVEN_73439-1 [Araneus ventricosus]
MPIDEADETPKCSLGTSNTVSPFDISPVPNIKKRATTQHVLEYSRGKRPSRGQEWKDQGPSKKENSTKKRYNSSSDSSDYLDPSLVDSDDDINLDINLDINDGDKPDSREATCIFCDGKFSEDTRGEVWVKCVMCQMWAHLDCAGAKIANYVCDFCKEFFL